MESIWHIYNSPIDEHISPLSGSVVNGGCVFSSTVRESLRFGVMALLYVGSVSWLVT